MKTTPLIAVRQARETDLPWIYSTFIKSMANQKNMKSVEPHICAAMLHSMCTRVLTHCVCVVACDPSDEDQTYAYAIGDPEHRLLVWVYTKNDFRGFRVATRLLEALLGGVGSEPIGLVIATSASRHLDGKWLLVPRADAIGRMR
jgi:hypothetical protein